jgi:hypothetical protein
MRAAELSWNRLGPSVTPITGRRPICDRDTVGHSHALAKPGLRRKPLERTTIPGNVFATLIGAAE